MLLFCLFTFTIVLLLLDILLNYNNEARMLRKIPGPPYDFLFGNSLKIIGSSGKKFDVNKLKFE